MWSRLGASLALTAGIVLLAAPAAHAEDPVDLGGAYVLDSVGAISGDEARVQAALDSLYDRARIQLFVVYVGTFSNPSDPVDWADAAAVDNGLGSNDVLLAVALDDRQYALSIDDDFPLSDSQLDDVEARIEDSLRDDAWADAAVNGAEALEAAATGVVGPNVPVDPDAGADGGGIPILPIVGGAAVVGVGVFVYSRIRRRNRDGSAAAAPEQMTQAELDRRAGSLLVQLDDSLKTSEQELGFAIAQFGDDATREFTATLESAKAKVAQAFALKQRLDDAEADSDADRRAWTTQIVQFCEAADAELDAQADAFDGLRQLEKTAPAALADVIALAATAADRRTAAKAALAELAERYSPAAVQPVGDNIAQADKLLSFAAVTSERAKAALDAGKPGDAAIAVRSAQASLGQVGQLFDAIDTLKKDLDEASTKLEAVVADTTDDIAAAKALPRDASAAGLVPAIAAAEAALAGATSARLDPIAGLARAEKANASLEQVFAGVRDAQAGVARTRTQLDASLAAARAQVAGATEYITTRRGGVTESARTRLSEADRHLAKATALAASDPVAALAEAQRANELATRAFELASEDVRGYEAGFNRPSSSGFDGSDGADLAGIFGDWLFGSGSGGGWSSGGSRRSSWSGGSSRSSSRSRSGSFGGSSRSSSRGSGGGRSRGGRF